MRAVVIIGNLLLGVWISVPLEDGMNFGGNPQGLFVPLASDASTVATNAHEVG